MTHYQIALNFEDGVTRFIDCASTEKVLDAAFRHRINLPMDCSDGVCGTCKCRAESGQYDLGDDYIEDALTQDEAEAGLVLTCQMKPSSDCVIAVPLASSACKTGTGRFQAQLAGVTRHGDAAFELALDTSGDAPVFLPGQYVNIEVPGTGERRAYSFSSAPGDKRLTFLIRKVPDGLMSNWLDGAEPALALALTGPLGSFYLRKVERPLLFLAGGTGLAPFLSMLEVLQREGVSTPVHLVYGVTRDQDLVRVDALQSYAERLPNFSYLTCVADGASAHARRGYVTDHLAAEHLHGGEVDTYLCGPPPMVDAVQRHFRATGIEPRSFHYEKFVPNTAPAREAVTA
ncbi:MAG: Benzoate 1,2-dioxygenase electron transfer component [Paracidovorax wautersii]|uniref:Benzoate 1,2-dioxygenase electron transfer component n=1 Tax=Paracidovorax wautersii TaxID=1177982 RepID=A0A7V8JRU6_9BURK|nr:MAG: Benzoate 1,2-dioxygenase electron transfer component [Paracidovorax wautersii]